MLILTRPLPAARRTAHALRQAGVAAPILFSPVLRIEPLPIRDLPCGVPVFTSENGVHSVAGQMPLTGRRVIAVGPATAAAAAAYGASCETLGGTADALALALIARKPEQYVHLHGAHVSGDLVGRLRAAGLEAEGRIVYDQRHCPLTEAARRALLDRRHVVLPLYSPRSARLIAEDLGEPPRNTRVIALSVQVVRSWPWTEGALVAKSTESQAMLAAIAAALAAQD